MDAGGGGEGRDHCSGSGGETRQRGGLQGQSCLGGLLRRQPSIPGMTPAVAPTEGK